MAAVDTVVGLPDADWTTAAEKLRISRDQFNQIAVGLRLTRPPKELASAHAKLVSSVELMATFTDAFRQALADKDIGGLTTATNDSTTSDQRIAELRSEWRNSVLAYAQRGNLSVPKWAQEVGNRK
jgi:hypothetical protein